MQGLSMEPAWPGRVVMPASHKQPTALFLTVFSWLTLAAGVASATPLLTSAAGEPEKKPTNDAVREFVGHDDAVWSVAFSPDGRLAVSGSYDRTLRLWTVATGKEVRRFEGHTKAITAVAFSPDGRQILSGSADNALRLWDRETGKEVLRFEGHTGTVTTVAFLADGKSFLS